MSQPNLQDSQQAMYATAPHGLQHLLTDELRQLGATDIKIAGAGARFHSSRANAYRICLESRIANRVLLPVHRGKADSPDSLYQRVREVDWSAHMNVDTTFSIDFFCDSSSITHSGFGAQKTKDAIVDQFREQLGERPSVDRKQPDLRINAYLFRDNLRLAIDWSGRSLHQRGYRNSDGVAPIKENLAAATLLANHWPERFETGQVLHDPMCGSGTFLIEAALMAADIAPGLLRERFGFQGWRQHDEALWQPLRRKADERAQAGIELLRSKDECLSGADTHHNMLAAARENLDAAGLTDVVTISQRDFFDQQNPLANKGLVVFNPPYGERLSSNRTPAVFYRDCSRVLHQQFAGWQVALVVPQKSPHHLLRLGKSTNIQKPDNDQSQQPLMFSNGGIACRVVSGSLPNRTNRGIKTQIADKQDNQSFAKSTTAETQGLDLANRLRKNRKRLNSWLKRDDITAYRLYDADIPAYAVAIDLYNGLPVNPEWSGGRSWHPSIDPRGLTTGSTRSSKRDSATESRLTTDDSAEMHAVMQEYRAPATIDPTTAANRLEQAIDQTKNVCELPDSRLHVKLRERQKGKWQYTRQQDTNRRILVNEYGCDLLVNPSDYLDTGLFTDLRKVRHYIQGHSDKKKFLNLFCYTASATVHAIRGGATGSVSVDSSKRYLYWAADNLSLTDCKPADHQLVRDDVMSWLGQNQDMFDLILLDPPTFSNSSRTDSDWDVQRNHAECIRLCLGHLSAHGLIIFSTNFKRFRIDEKLAASAAVEERSDWSISPDYANNRKIHRCWFIKHRQS